MPALDSLWKRNLADLEPYWEQVFAILGDTATVLPLVGLGDDGAPTAASFKTRRRTSSGLEAVFTWSEPPSAFDTPFDPTDPASWQGIVPMLVFNGSDEEADTPDVAGWSPGSGAADSAFSVGGWFIIINTATTRTIMGKDNNGVAREWYLVVQTDDTLRLARIDDSAGVGITIDTDAAVPAGRLVHLVATSDDSEAPSGMEIYVDGALVATTEGDNGSYVATEDTAALMTFAHRLSSSAISAPFIGSVAGGALGPFFTEKELNAAEVKRLYTLGRAALGLG